MLKAFGKRCSRPASPYDGLSRSDKIRPCDELTHLMGAREKQEKCKLYLTLFCLLMKLLLQVQNKCKKKGAQGRQTIIEYKMENRNLFEVAGRSG